MFTSHDDRLHALKMLLRSIHTADPAVRTRYERLAELWLAVAERRERVDAGAAPGMPGASAAADAWKPIDTAPQRQEIEAMATAWGPRIWLRNREQASRGRWRAYGPSRNPVGKGPSPRAGWEDLERKPLTFVPTEWRELGD